MKIRSNTCQCSAPTTHTSEPTLICYDIYVWNIQPLSFTFLFADIKHLPDLGLGFRKLFKKNCN